MKRKNFAEFCADAVSQAIGTQAVREEAQRLANKWLGIELRGHDVKSGFKAPAGAVMSESEEEFAEEVESEIDEIFDELNNHCSERKP
jgi:hypothetical protein